MIKCENINLSFPQLIICEDLSFELRSGGSVCFGGPSGKGKSSLLKVLMGFVIPQSGEIIINDLELNSENIDVIRKDMAWLPQNSNLPVNTGIELIEMLEMDKDRKDHFRNYLDQLDVLHCGENNLFSQISGGQKQRIILAACLSLNKAILLLDEPTSALDDQSINLLFKTLDTIKDKMIVSTSHNQKWIDYCTQTITL